MIFNQLFYPQSTMETFSAKGLRGLFDFSWESAFSIRTLSFLAFVAMVALMMLGNTFCKDVLAEIKQTTPDGVHRYTGDDEEAARETTPE